MPAGAVPCFSPGTLLPAVPGAPHAILSATAPIGNRVGGSAHPSPRPHGNAHVIQPVRVGVVPHSASCDAANVDGRGCSSVMSLECGFAGVLSIHLPSAHPAKKPSTRTRSGRRLRRRRFVLGIAQGSTYAGVRGEQRN